MLTIDLSGPEGNTFALAGRWHGWSKQLWPDEVPPPITKATVERLGHNHGTYHDVLDTFDIRFKGVVDYEFINDPRGR